MHVAQYQPMAHRCTSNNLFRPKYNCQLSRSLHGKFADKSVRLCANRVVVSGAPTDVGLSLAPCLRHRHGAGLSEWRSRRPRGHGAVPHWSAGAAGVVPGAHGVPATAAGCGASRSTHQGAAGQCIRSHNSRCVCSNLLRCVYRARMHVMHPRCGAAMRLWRLVWFQPLSMHCSYQAAQLACVKADLS